jgi:hypothetical protein
VKDFCPKRTQLQYGFIKPLIDGTLHLALEEKI